MTQFYDAVDSVLGIFVASFKRRLFYLGLGGHGPFPEWKDWVNVSRAQAASPPIKGHFRLRYGNETTHGQGLCINFIW